MKRLAIVLALLLLAPASARAQTATTGSQDPAPLPATSPPVSVSPPYAPSAPLLATPPQYIQSSPRQPEGEVPNGFSAKFWGGAGYRRIYSIGIFGGNIGLAAGMQRRHIGLYGGASLLLGRTDFGLATKQVESMAIIEGRFGRLRIGASGHLTYVNVQRITSSDAFDAIGGGFTLLGSVDLARTEEGHALYLCGEFGGDALVVPNAPLIWGPTLALGLRY